MPNVLDDIMPKVLSGALESLRDNCVMPRLVNADYSNDANKKGNKIEVPIPTGIDAVDVVPGPFAPTPTDLEINTALVPLNNWKEAAFYLTDREISEIMDGAIPMQVSEAGKAIANSIDVSLLDLYKQAYNYVGTPGTTPFETSTLAAQQARKVLNANACPGRDRRVVLDVDADANATGLAAFQSADRAGTDITIAEGLIGRKLGFDWYFDQLMPNHVAGTATGFLINSATHAIGDKSVAVDTGTGTFVEGDIFTVAGDTQTYTVVSFASNVITYEPAAKTAFADNAAVTRVASHSVNLAFHRDAIALAVRPLVSSELELALGGQVMTMTDPLSGIPLRLEVRREHKRVRWSVDALWGVGAVRPSCMARIVG